MEEGNHIVVYQNLRESAYVSIRQQIRRCEQGNHILVYHNLRERDISEGHVAKKLAYATDTLRILYLREGDISE